MIFSVLLVDGTVGKIDSDSLDRQHADQLLGEVVRVKLADENGNTIEREGRLVEVLEESDY